MKDEMLINREGYYGGQIFYGALSKQRILLKLIRSYERKMMEKEEALLSSLSHENIARIFYSIKLTRNEGLLLTEFIGKNVKDYVGRLNEMEMRSIMHQLVMCMSYLQDKRIVYLGLSPKNVYILENSGDLIVKLINFQNALKIDCNGEIFELDEPDEGFSAPEIMDYMEKTVYLSSDIYSLGCLYFYILSGGYKMTQIKYPIQIEIISSRMKIINEKTTFYILFKHLIEKMLEFNPNKRIQPCDIKNHPSFWTAKESAEFIVQTGILIEKDQKYFDYLNQHGKNVIDSDWTKNLNLHVVQVLKEIRQNSKKSSSSQDDFIATKAGYLVKTIRNTLVHATDERLIPILGTNAENLIKFWNEKFPFLILFLHESKHAYVQGVSGANLNSNRD
jgi:serine/threonine protein kinase